MAKPAFWPGFKWRVLAHRRPKKHEPWATDSFQLRAGMPVSEHGTFQHLLGDNWELDELVIDDWFHIEQMSERNWWIGVGNGNDYWHVNVHIDRDGKATVSIERQLSNGP